MVGPRSEFVNSLVTRDLAEYMVLNTRPYKSLLFSKKKYWVAAWDPADGPAAATWPADGRLLLPASWRMEKPGA
jgi:hypothetical protein